MQCWVWPPEQVMLQSPLPEQLVQVIPEQDSELLPQWMIPMAMSASTVVARVFMAASRIPPVDRFRIHRIT
jgi:hypothetical protein